MKTQFVLSERVAGFLQHGRNFNEDQIAKVIQASEAVLNDRQITSSEELGMKNKVKDDYAESSVLAKFRSQRSVVTAWIEYSQAKSGRVDRMATKAEKLGVVCTVADIPSTFAGQAIGEWVAQFGPEAEAVLPPVTPEQLAQQEADDAEMKAIDKARAKAKAKAKRGKLGKLVEKAKRAKSDLKRDLQRQNKPAEPVEAGQSNGQH